MTGNNNEVQLTLEEHPCCGKLDDFPSTRYQGSKRRIIRWIQENVEHLNAERILDCFGGTGIVSYMFKTMGKAVTFNDYLYANCVMARALIENSTTRLDENKLNNLLLSRDGSYGNFIEKTFKNIYFTSEENRRLDCIVQNIRRMSDRYEQSIAFFALFQACIIKRPYNLFHRRNLYMRTSDVPRSFGNKVTWDRPFDRYMVQFTREANAAVFDNGKENRVLNRDVFELETNDYDLVYIDPPYVSASGVGVDYHQFYHFLEGLAKYDEWGSMIDWSSKHRRLKPKQNPWTTAAAVTSAFRALFEKFQDCAVVVSYRSPGIPSQEELVGMLRSLGKDVHVETVEHQYVLSKPVGRTHEILLVAM